MLSHVSKQTWVRSAVVAAIFLMIFIIINFVLPAASNSSSNMADSIKRQEAITIGSDFISLHTGEAISNVEVLYNADQHYTAYLDYKKGAKEHFELIDNIYPYEYFTVYALLAESNLEAKVDINVATGKIVGWDIPISEQYQVDEASEAAVTQALAEQGFPTNTMTLQKQEDGTYVASNESILNATDAVVSVRVAAIQVENKPFISQYNPSVSIPASYLSDIEKQDKMAKWITYGGFIAFSIVLAILAIIYSILYRKHTSFKYGLIFTAIATIIACIAQMAMVKHILILQNDTLRTDTFMLIFMNIFIFISVLVSAVSHYFSFVAGDGLWKAQGFNLWPRFKEKEFGSTVWNSMLIAFLFALTGFGLQAVIFEGLSFIIGTHMGIDSEQSPLNSSMMWFFPMLAWFAAITEEAVYRYFGVGIFRRWFKNTYVAAIIPSLIWACGHAMYPLYPATTRIVELVIIGVILTWVMVKFGLLTAIFTHAIFNTIAMSMTIMSYGEGFDILMGVFYIIMPIIVAYVIKLIHKQYMKKRPEPIAPAEPPTYGNEQPQL